ncbi:MAG: hypothetical protein ABJB40_06600 [Acidobacteriota bacterium]
MSENQQITAVPSIGFCSSLKDDVWHDQKGRNAFESWHFDALSDDGREALIITFDDSYSFSSRYYRQERNGNGASSDDRKRFPAVSFTYAVDGRVVMRAVNEFRADEFTANQEANNCSIGRSKFRVDAAEYGPRFLLQIDLITSRRCQLKAELEWLSIETDLNAPDNTEQSAASWNMVAPRSDVSGRITLTGRKEKTGKVFHFRGTGYHDHFRSESSLRRTLGSRCWGRAHFVDSTAIFHRHQTVKNGDVISKLFLVREGDIHERDAQSETQNQVRDRYGLKIPRRLSFVSDDNIRLRVKPLQVIESGFFKKSMVSEITLMLRDGRPRKTMGITEFIAPGRLKNPLFRWFSDLRTARNGRSPLF